MPKRTTVPGLLVMPAFCHATRAGDIVFVSGTLGTTDEKGTLAPGGIGPQTTQTLRNIEIILEASDACLKDVVKFNVFLADLGDFSEMNKAYIGVLGEGAAARITVGGADLALNASIEIDCVAHAPI